jgi:hypothetical protein
MTSTGIAAPQGTESVATAGRQGVKDLLTGAAEGAANTVGSSVAGVAKLLHKIPYVGETLAPQAGIQNLEALTAERSQPQNTAQQIGRTGEQIGELMLPSGAEEHLPALAARLPWLGRAALPLLRTGANALEMGARNVSQGGNFGTGAEIGAGAGVLGEGARALAPSQAESAMNVTAPMRGHGRDIGKALIEETSGVRPQTVAQEAQQRMSALTQDLESRVHAATQAGAQISTDPAHQVLDNAIAKAPRNARGYIEKLQGLRSLLDLSPASSPGPQQRIFSPDDILEMKRGIGTEIDTWEPQLRKTVEPVKRQMYGALDHAVDAAAPGTEEINQTLSSLSAGKKAAYRVGKTASVPQQVMNRMKVATGALAGSGIGAYEGEKYGGTPGAIVGGLTGLIAPPVIASPTTQMLMARGMANPRFVLNPLTGTLLQLDRSQSGLSDLAGQLEEARQNAVAASKKPAQARTP